MLFSKENKEKFFLGGKTLSKYDLKDAFKNNPAQKEEHKTISACIAFVSCMGGSHASRLFNLV
jgi:hypothetical protein